jgi:hypothetical protein
MKMYFKKMKNKIYFHQYVANAVRDDKIKKQERKKRNVMFKAVV